MWDGGLWGPHWPGLRGYQILTYHWGLNEAPRVGLWHIGLKDTRGSACLIDSTEHVDLATAHSGRC